MGFQERILQRSTFNSGSGLCSVLAGPHSPHVKPPHARKFSCSLPHNVFRPAEANIDYPSVIPWSGKAFPFSWTRFTFPTEMIVRDRRDMNHSKLHVWYQLIWSCPLSINMTFSLQCFPISFFFFFKSSWRWGIWKPSLIEGQTSTNNIFGKRQNQERWCWRTREHLSADLPQWETLYKCCSWDSVATCGLKFCSHISWAAPLEDVCQLPHFWRIFPDKVLLSGHGPFLSQ